MSILSKARSRLPAQYLADGGLAWQEWDAGRGLQSALGEDGTWYYGTPDNYFDSTSAATDWWRNQNGGQSLTAGGVQSRDWGNAISTPTATTYTPTTFAKERTPMPQGNHSRFNDTGNMGKPVMSDFTTGTPAGIMSPAHGRYSVTPQQAPGGIHYGQVQYNYHPFDIGNFATTHQSRPVTPLPDYKFEIRPIEDGPIEDDIVAGGDGGGSTPYLPPYLPPYTPPTEDTPLPLYDPITVIGDTPSEDIAEYLLRNRIIDETESGILVELIERDIAVGNEVNDINNYIEGARGIAGGRNTQVTAPLHTDIDPVIGNRSGVQVAQELAIGDIVSPTEAAIIADLIDGDKAAGDVTDLNVYVEIAKGIEGGRIDPNASREDQQRQVEQNTGLTTNIGQNTVLPGTPGYDYRVGGVGEAGRGSLTQDTGTANVDVETGYNTSIEGNTGYYYTTGQNEVTPGSPSYNYRYQGVGEAGRGTQSQVVGQIDLNPPGAGSTAPGGHSGDLTSSIIDSEGSVLDSSGNHVAYKDHLGNWTIGYGTTHIDGRPVQPGDTISEAEAQSELQTDIDTAVNAASRNVGNYDSLSPDLQNALAEQAYQLGGGGQAQFRKMIDAIERGDYDAAILEAQDSLWANQTPARVAELVAALEAEAGLGTRAAVGGGSTSNNLTTDDKGHVSTGAADVTDRTYARQKEEEAQRQADADAAALAEKRVNSGAHVATGNYTVNGPHGTQTFTGSDAKAKAEKYANASGTTAIPETSSRSSATITNTNNNSVTLDKSNKGVQAASNVGASGGALHEALAAGNAAGLTNTEAALAWQQSKDTSSQDRHDAQSHANYQADLIRSGGDGELDASGIRTKKQAEEFAKEHGLRYSEDDGVSGLQRTVKDANAKAKLANDPALLEEAQSATRSKDKAQEFLRELGYGNYDRDTAPDILNAKLRDVNAAVRRGGYTAPTPPQPQADPPQAATPSVSPGQVLQDIPWMDTQIRGSLSDIGLFESQDIPPSGTETHQVPSDAFDNFTSYVTRTPQASKKSQVSGGFGSWAGSFNQGGILRRNSGGSAMASSGGIFNQPQQIQQQPTYRGILMNKFNRRQ